MQPLASATNVDNLWRWVDQVLVLVQRDDELAEQARSFVLTRDHNVDRAQHHTFVNALTVRLAGDPVLSTMPPTSVMRVLDLAYDELIGISVVGPLWRDDDVTEILVDGWNRIRIERGGHIEPTPISFRDPAHGTRVARDLAAKVSDRSLTPTQPYVTAELPGARVTLMVHRIVKSGLAIAMRKFRPLMGMNGLLRYEALTGEMAEFLADCVRSQANILVSGGTGTGKAVDVNTPIATTAGWSTMGELKAGDQVFDENGHPTTVMFAHDVMHNRECFEVCFSDGSTIVADAEHLWRTETRSSRRAISRQKNSTRARRPYLSSSPRSEADTLRDRETLTVTALAQHLNLNATQSITLRSLAAATLPSRGQPHATARSTRHTYDARELVELLQERGARLRNDQRHRCTTSDVRTTRQILETLTWDNKYTNHSIEVAGPVQPTNTTDLLLDPYLLGVWLGDGAKDQARITSADAFIPQQFADAGFPTTRVANCDIEYGVRELRVKLRELGVLGNKHIPAPYLFATVEQRWALLQGLMDTDGTVDRGGSVSFSASNEKLALQVRSLVASLGIIANMTSRIPVCNGKNGIRDWNICFSSDQAPFKLQRKIDAWNERCGNARTERSKRRYITAVRPVQTRPVRCITVDSPNSMYLVGDQFIPTHNTTMINALSEAIPQHERVITIEDAYELSLHVENWVALQSLVKASADDAVHVDLARLLIESLRMRPDRIIVGEIRDAAAAAVMLEAANTGHEGTMTTVHASSVQRAVNFRLANWVRAGANIDSELAVAEIANAFQLIVQIDRHKLTGSRYVSEIAMLDVENLHGGVATPTTLWKAHRTIRPDGTAATDVTRPNAVAENSELGVRLASIGVTRWFTTDTPQPVAAPMPAVSAPPASPFEIAAATPTAQVAPFSAPPQQ